MGSRYRRGGPERSVWRAVPEDGEGGAGQGGLADFDRGQIEWHILGHMTEAVLPMSPLSILRPGQTHRIAVVAADLFEATPLCVARQFG